MNIKKYSDIEYIAIKQRKPLWIAIILILIFFMTLQIAIAVKCFIELATLYNENQDLKRVIETQSSMIADIQEDNLRLQEMIK